MATITGLTAARMLQIEAATVTDGEFDSAGHLILERHDGTTFDAGVFPDATEGTAGIVELATNAEILAGTDTVRAVTPAGLASIPGDKVQILAYNALAETALPTAYPDGVCVLPLSTGSGWSLAGGFGTVITSQSDADRVTQTFYTNSGGSLAPRAWVRTYHGANGGGGWTTWAQMMLMPTLSSTGVTQSIPFTSYPQGQCRLYFTTAATGWDFSGMAGEVITYTDSVDFAKQTFIQHVGGSSAKPAMWYRTANAASGWSAWMPVLADPGAWTTYTPAWTTSSGTATPSIGNGTYDCRVYKLGRKVDVKFEVTFGSTTNFGGGGTGDNFRFSLPYAAARSSETIGSVEMFQSIDSCIFGRAKITSTTTFGLTMSTGRPNSVAIANAGDVDAVSPWTWANGHTIKGMLTYESAS